MIFFDSISFGLHAITRLVGEAWLTHVRGPGPRYVRSETAWYRVLSSTLIDTSTWELLIAPIDDLSDARELNQYLPRYTMQVGTRILDCFSLLSGCVAGLMASLLLF